MTDNENLAIRNMIDKENLAIAIDTVARHVVRTAVFNGITGGRIAWEHYPELAEVDWEAVSFRALQLADSVDRPLDEYRAAYNLLEARATDD